MVMHSQHEIYSQTPEGGWKAGQMIAVISDAGSLWQGFVIQPPEQEQGEMIIEAHQPEMHVDAHTGVGRFVRYRIMPGHDKMLTMTNGAPMNIRTVVPLREVHHL